MKFSLEFIKEFFDPKRNAEAIAQALTMAGLEIEQYQRVEGDFIFDAEVTSNRYDWLSIFGIANELACLCKAPFTLTKTPLLKKPLLKEKKIVIKDFNDCPVYIARLIKGVTVGVSTPTITQRLINCGLNTINNAVDITNYCMLKWGNPLHAFDYDKIEGDIFIRRAKEGERFIGLDDKKRILNRDNLVISDEKKVIALAGVMGAKNTEVDHRTKNILLEAAYFSPLTIRRSRTKANCNTESSYRFERSTSAQLLEIASNEAAERILKACTGTFAGYAKEGKEPLLYKKKIFLSLKKLNAYIGDVIAVREATSILRNLGCSVTKKSSDTLEVYPSCYRLDLTHDVDLIEEIARIYGYNKISEKLPVFTPGTIHDAEYVFKRRIRNLLVALGLYEVITYSLTGQKTLAAMQEKDFIALTNPLRSQENVLRTTLLTGMIDAVRYNLNQKNDEIRFFEIAHTYQKEKNAHRESSVVSVCATEATGGFFYVKAIVEELTKALHLNGTVFTPKQRPCFYNSVDIISDGICIGFLGKLDDSLCAQFDLHDTIYCAELAIGALIKMKKTPLYNDFSRYPHVARDLSVGFSEQGVFEDVRTILLQEAGSFLSDYRIIDEYKDASSGKIFFTLRVFYQSKERTLTSQEVDDIHTKVRKRISEKKEIILR